ncbi:cytosolic Fe-S cluster assembly factor cfd1 [Massospora cicadina]|nr:cytosolic Fe-S cluster assembly factor cfd1 [Massospora cicadina]
MVDQPRGYEKLADIRHIVLVLSGKGGVGKSCVTVQLAASLSLLGNRVGVLDVDLCGPSVPRLLGVDTHSVMMTPRGHLLGIMFRSLGLGFFCFWCLARMLATGSGGRGWVVNLHVDRVPHSNKDASIVWRGPKKTAMIRQFFTDVDWGRLDYLLVDTPPGTSDEHIALAELLKSTEPDGAILVTTPQEVALADVRKELNFCRKTGINILGVVENMAGFECPHCKGCTNLFSSGGGEALAGDFGVPFLGSIPINPKLTELFEAPYVTPSAATDAGRSGQPEPPANFLALFARSPTSKHIRKIVELLPN